MLYQETPPNNKNQHPPKPENRIHPATSITKESGVKIPAYLQEKYWWAYLHPRAVRFWDNKLALNTILWGNMSRLKNSTLNELGKEKIKGKILQISCVYGDITKKLANRLSDNAHLDVIDVAPIQLENLQKKITGYNNVSLHCQNADSLQFDNNTFDQSLLFFLLHEVPNDIKRKILKEAIRTLKPGGKLVIVDYHKPVLLHPHFYIMWVVLKTLEPFALDMWKKEVTHFLPDNFQPADIKKTTLFGGLYQTVTIIKPHNTE